MKYYIDHILAVREVCAACQFSESGMIPGGVMNSNRIWQCRNSEKGSLAILAGFGIPVSCIMAAEHALAGQGAKRIEEWL